MGGGETMDIKFTDGRYTEVVGDYTIRVWEHSREVTAFLTGHEYEDTAEVSDQGVVFGVQERERGYGHNGDLAEDRAFPVTMIERMIAVWRALGGE